MQSSSSACAVSLNFEPLGSHHNRAAFRCEDSYVDHQAQLLFEMQSAGLTRAFVATAANSNEIIGLYAMNPHMVQIWHAPPFLEEAIQRFGLEGIPAAYISLFAVHKPYQGQGLGSIMFMDALRRIKKAAEGDLSPFLVILDPISERAERFYARFDFQRLGEASLRRMFYPVAHIP